MKIPNWLIAGMVAVLLAGCAVGTDFDESRVSRIHKGETTEAQLVELFGPPQKRWEQDGRTTLMWRCERHYPGYSQDMITHEWTAMHGAVTVKKLLVTLQGGTVCDISSSNSDSATSRPPAD